MKSEPSPSYLVRSRLDHPVIDSDGHFIESVSTFLDYLKSVAGVGVANRFHAVWTQSHIVNLPWYQLTPEQRRDQRAVRAPWWALPTTNTLDRATAMFPKLLYERLDEMGLDFSVLYPGLGLAAPALDDDEVRRASCRALNNLYADMFRDFGRRLTPVAVIPMHTPAEAIEELEHAVNELGFKVVVMASYVKRPIKAVERDYPAAVPYAFWLDTYGLDSEYDYDPVWAKCVELKVVPTFHTAGYGWAWRNSISNFMFNHIGHFAASARGSVPLPVHGRSHSAFPRAEFRVPGRRRRLGAQFVERHGGTLGEAQSKSYRQLRSGQSQSRAAYRPEGTLRRTVDQGGRNGAVVGQPRRLRQPR